MTSTCHHHEIHQDDFGRWRVGLSDDGAGPFESRGFAMSVAGYLPTIVAPRTIFFKIKKEGRLAALSSA